MYDSPSIGGPLARSRRNPDPDPLQSLSCERYTNLTMSRTSAQGAYRCPARPLRKLKPDSKPFSAPFVRDQALESIDALCNRTESGAASVKNAATASRSILIWSSTSALSDLQSPWREPQFSGHHVCSRIHLFPDLFRLPKDVPGAFLTGSI